MTRSIADLEPAVATALAQIKARLKNAFGDRLRRVILYGSQARGDANEDSDIDVMVLLEPPVDYFRELRSIRDCTYDIQVESGLPYISFRPAATDVFDRQEYEIYRAVKEEGIEL